MSDINIITLQDLDDTQFDTSNADGSNKIKLKNNTTSINGVSLAELPMETPKRGEDWLVLHKGKLALATPTWLAKPTLPKPDIYARVDSIREGVKPYVSDESTTYSHAISFHLGRIDSEDDTYTPKVSFTVTGLDQDGVESLDEHESTDVPDGVVVNQVGPWTIEVENLRRGDGVYITYNNLIFTKPGTYTFTATATLLEGEDSDLSNNSATYTIDIIEDPNKKPAPPSAIPVDFRAVIQNLQVDNIGLGSPYVSNGEYKYVHHLRFEGAVLGEHDFLSDYTMTIEGLDQGGVDIVKNRNHDKFLYPPHAYDTIGGTKIERTGMWEWKVTDNPRNTPTTVNYRVMFEKPGTYTFKLHITPGAGAGKDSNLSNNSATYTVDIRNWGEPPEEFSVVDYETKDKLLVSKFKGYVGNPDGPHIAENRLNIYSDGKSMKGRGFIITGSRDIRVYKLSSNKTMEAVPEANQFTPYSISKNLVFSPLAEAFLKFDGDARITGKLVYDSDVPANIETSNLEVEFVKASGYLKFKNATQDSTAQCGTQLYAIVPNDIKKRIRDTDKPSPYVVVAVAQSTDIIPDTCPPDTLIVRDENAPKGAIQVVKHTDGVMANDWVPSLLTSDKAKWIGDKAPHDLVLPVNDGGPTLCPDIAFLDGRMYYGPAITIKVKKGSTFDLPIESRCFYFEETTVSSTNAPFIEIHGAGHQCRVSVYDVQPGAVVHWGPLTVVCEDF